MMKCQMSFVCFLSRRTMLAGVMFAMTIATSSSLSFLTLKNTLKSTSSSVSAKLSLQVLPFKKKAKESSSTMLLMMISTTAADDAESSSSSSSSNSQCLPSTSPASAEEKQLVNKKEEEKERNFVFGYGSLICDQSRALSMRGLSAAAGGGGGGNKVAAAAVATALPVTIHHVERVWSARTKNGWTAMGVRFENGKQCTGVLIEVTADELADLDKREASYNRCPIGLDQIEPVSFLNPQEFYHDHHPVFDAKENNNNNNAAASAADELIKVWIYTQRHAILADSSHPIPQSYVDIILRGCLKISKDFAKSFIETTHGWDQHDDDDDNLNYCFVDDREVPIYPKADADFSNDHGNKRIIDQLLQELIPDAMEDRVDYDPLHHLEALSDALEKDKAHPRAIKHIVKIIVKQAAAKSKADRQEDDDSTRSRLPDDGHPLVT